MANEILLVENCGYASLVLNEGTGGATKFRGKFQEANGINKNMRMYPFEVLNSNVEKLLETIENRGLYGELDHAQDSIIHLANASHVVTKLWWEGNNLIGEAEILPTPMGKILKSLIESGTRVGISSRGVGNGERNNEGVLVIGESYKLITFDAVADPSTYSAYQSKIAKESFAPRPVVVSRTVNPKTLISYIGQVLQKEVDEKKQKAGKK